MFRLLKVLALYFTLILLIVGCSQGSSTNSDTNKAKAEEKNEEKQPLTIAMTTWGGYGLVHLAKEKGYFDKHGVLVDIKIIEDKAQTAGAFAANRIDGWAATVDQFIYFDAEKIGAKQVLSTDFSEGGEGIIVTNDIQSIEDLRGKTVGAQVGSSTYFFLLNVLNDAGLALEDIIIKDMNAGDAGAAFVAGHLDAAATWDPWLTKSKDKGHVLVNTSEKPGLLVDTIAFSSDVIEKRESDVEAFVKGYFDAYNFWIENKEESNQIMAKSLGIELDTFIESLEGFIYQSKEENLEYFRDGGQLFNVIEKGSKIYKEAGLVDSTTEPDQIVDNRFLD